jgi:hypothetical protein
MVRPLFPAPGPGGGGTGAPVPAIPNPTVPGQPTPSIPIPNVQPPQTLPTRQRQYPNLDPKWFSSPTAHQGVSLAIRNLYDMNYDAQDAIKILTTSNPGLQLSLTPIQGSGAVNANQRANYLITAPSAAAMTLGGPRPGIDDGTVIQFTSSSAFQHTLTTPGILQTGAAAVTTATWPAHAGGSLTLVANAGKWLVQSSNGIAFS